MRGEGGWSKNRHNKGRFSADQVPNADEGEGDRAVADVLNGWFLAVLETGYPFLRFLLPLHS